MKYNLFIVFNGKPSIVKCSYAAGMLGKYLLDSEANKPYIAETYTEAIHLREKIISICKNLTYFEGVTIKGAM